MEVDVIAFQFRICMGARIAGYFKYNLAVFDPAVFRMLVIRVDDLRHRRNGENIIHLGVSLEGTGNGYYVNLLPHRRSNEDFALDDIGLTTQGMPKLNVIVTVRGLFLFECERVGLRNGKTAHHIYGSGFEIKIVGVLFPWKDHNLELQSTGGLGKVGIEDPGMVSGEHIICRHGESDGLVALPGIVEDGTGNTFVRFPDVDRADLGRRRHGRIQAVFILPGRFHFVPGAAEQQLVRMHGDTQAAVLQQRRASFSGNNG